MHFEEITYCPYPADEVYGAMLWHVQELVPFMDNVASITPDTFDESTPGIVKTVRFWQGTAAAIPAFVRPFVSKSSLAWTDVATWTLGEYRIDWESITAQKAFTTCKGTNRFEPDPERPETHTRCVISGDFTIHGDKLPATPAFVGRALAPKIERLILSYVLPNFRALAVGIGGWLDAKYRPR